jgi:hypothetical protein
MTGGSAVRENRAARWTASALGVVAGVGGMEHGLFEILQGKAPTNGMVIDAIGPAQRFWTYGTEPAFTLLPSFLAAGILAVTTGLLVTVWSIAFVGRKLGVVILALLAALMFLAGGGFAPPVFAVLAIAAAAAIRRPLTIWRGVLPATVRRFLSWLWPGTLILLTALSLLLMACAVFGYPLMWFTDADGVLGFNSTGGFITFLGLGPLCLLTMLASDVQRQAEGTR